MARFERRGYRRFGPSMDVPKPVNAGEEYDVEINEVGSRGDGIARVKNFVVFVNGAKQGEKARIKITEVRDRFAIGEKVGAAEAAAETSEEVKVGAAEAAAETSEEVKKEPVEAEEKTEAEEETEEVEEETEETEEEA